MLGTCTLCLARSASLREAADVLRTYRRAAGGDEKQKVNASRVFCRNYSTMSKNASKNRVRSVPKAAKNGQDVPKVAKKYIRASKNEKKGDQDRKMCQHGPNMA